MGVKAKELDMIGVSREVARVDSAGIARAPIFAVSHRFCLFPAAAERS